MALKSSVRIYLPESSVSYDTHDTDKAIEWNLHNYYVMQLEPGKTRKQDIFLSKSEVYFESKWALVEIQDKNVPFIEFTEGSAWTESMTRNYDFYSTVYFRTAPKMRVYSLDPYKIINLLGDMGGLLDIINAFGILVTM